MIFWTRINEINEIRFDCVQPSHLFSFPLIRHRIVDERHCLHLTHVACGRHEALLQLLECCGKIPRSWRLENGLSK